MTVPWFLRIDLSISPLILILTVDLLFIAFIVFMFVPYTPDLSKMFFIKGFGFFSKAFLASNEMIIGFFFVYMVDYINRYTYVKPSLDPCNEAYFIMVDDDLMYSWIWF